jgi:hypothetical protein
MYLQVPLCVDLEDMNLLLVIAYNVAELALDRRIASSTGAI